MLLVIDKTHYNARPPAATEYYIGTHTLGIENLAWNKVNRQ